MTWPKPPDKTWAYLEIIIRTGPLQEFKHAIASIGHQVPMGDIERNITKLPKRCPVELDSKI